MGMFFIVSAGILALLFNAAVSFKLINSELTENSQKVFQIVFIWLVPLIGAFVCLSVLNSETSINTNKRSKGNKTNITNDDAVNLAISSRDHSSGGMD